jgi:hypothetical protein
LRASSCCLTSSAMPPQRILASRMARSSAFGSLREFVSVSGTRGKCTIRSTVYRLCRARLELTCGLYNCITCTRSSTHNSHTSTLDTARPWSRPWHTRRCSPTAPPLCEGIGGRPVVAAAQAAGRGGGGRRRERGGGGGGGAQVGRGGGRPHPHALPLAHPRAATQAEVGAGRPSPGRRLGRLPRLHAQDGRRAQGGGRKVSWYGTMDTGHYFNVSVGYSCTFPPTRKSTR